MTSHFALVTLIALAACTESTMAPARVSPAEPAGQRSSQSQAFSATPPPGQDLPPSQMTPGPIPTEFRHVWAIEIADCKRDPGRTRIAIAPGAVKFYEGRSEVVSLEQTGAREAIMHVRHLAEGQNELQIQTLKVNDAGTTLTYGRGGSTYTYTRCD
jgi:hypothetical protein